MKRLFFIFLVLWLLAGGALAQSAGCTVALKMPCRLLSGISERDYSLYLPPSYYTDTQRRYPVLYLLHGGGDAHTAWEQRNHLSQVMNSLVQSDVAEEMIVVCPEANLQNMMYFNAMPDLAEGAPDWRYEDYFFNEMIPFIERSYRTRTDRGGRAVAGFSMGGGAATVYGVHHPEMFCMVYDISGYLRRQPLEFLRFDPSAEWRQQLIERNNPVERIRQGSDEEVAAWRQVDWKIAVGDHDFTLEANMDLVRVMRERDIPYAFYSNDGAHNDEWVNGQLGDVLQRASTHFRRQ